MCINEMIVSKYICDNFYLYMIYLYCSVEYREIDNKKQIYMWNDPETKNKRSEPVAHVIFLSQYIRRLILVRLFRIHFIQTTIILLLQSPTDVHVPKSPLPLHPRLGNLCRLIRINNLGNQLPFINNKRFLFT